MNQNYI